tara:strand:+ start:8550 stop:8747 length:198 start_codon:yes stop_codon:yes gene_type:complete
MANLGFSGEFVDEIRINMEGRTFEVYGSDGSCQKVTCEDTDQFMAVFKVTKKASEIDDQLKIVYV